MLRVLTCAKRIVIFHGTLNIGSMKHSIVRHLKVISFQSLRTGEANFLWEMS